MSTEDVLSRLSEPFPPQAVKQRQGGGGARFSYIAAPDIIRRLTRATGGEWSWSIRSFEFRPLPPLIDRRTGEPKEQSLVVVMGELTIPGLGTRAGIGVQKVSEAGGEDLVKGASTDALKKAATLFGVALELYGPDFEDDEPAPQPARPSPPARASAPPARQNGPGATQAPAWRQKHEPLNAAPVGSPYDDAERERLAQQVRRNDDALSPAEYKRHHELERLHKAPAAVHQAAMPAPRLLTDAEFKRVMEEAWTLVEDGKTHAEIVSFVRARRPSFTTEQTETSVDEVKLMRKACVARDQERQPAAFAG